MERFIERALLHNFERSEFEPQVKEQKVRIFEGIDHQFKKNKFKTIIEIANKFFTVQKAEDKEKIVIITLWESNKEEVDLWISNQ